MYDEKVRERALELLAEGLSHREVSRRLGGSPSPTCVRNWQEGHVSDNAAFFLMGDLVEFSTTDKLFRSPQDQRTADYVSGRFG